jgi:outer membrane protein with beta-barrel domain
MVKQLSRSLCVLALAAAVTPAAQAQLMDTGLYFEIAMGKADFKDVTSTVLDGQAMGFFDPYIYDVESSSLLQHKDRSYALISGYRFNPYLAAEAGYFRLGAYQYTSAGTLSDGTDTAPASLYASYRAKGFLMGGMVTLPLGNVFELRGRAGITSTDTRVKITYAINGTAESLKGSENSQDFYYGAGIGMKVWDYYRIGIDLMRHNKLGRANGNGSVDVDNVLVSFSYVY